MSRIVYKVQAENACIRLLYFEDKNALLRVCWSVFGERYFLFRDSSSSLKSAAKRDSAAAFCLWLGGGRVAVPGSGWQLLVCGFSTRQASAH